MNESFLWAEDSKYEKFYAKLPKALFVDGTVSVDAADVFIIFAMSW